MNETGLKAAGIRWRQAKEARDDEHQQCANVASAAHLAGITYVEMIPARAERARVAYWRSKHRAGTVDNAATLEEFRSAHRRALAAEANEQSARLAMHQTWESAHGVARGLIAALAGVDRGYVNAILGPSATAPHVDVTERDRILATVTSTSSAASEANLAYREAVRVRGHAFADRIKAGERVGEIGRSLGIPLQTVGSASVKWGPTQVPDPRPVWEVHQQVVNTRVSRRMAYAARLKALQSADGKLPRKTVGEAACLTPPIIANILHCARRHAQVHRAGADSR